MLLSIVVPTYNEKDNIIPFIKSVERVIRENWWDAEIVIVDDSSPDGTADIVRELREEFQNIELF